MVAPRRDRGRQAAADAVLSGFRRHVCADPDDHSHDPRRPRPIPERCDGQRDAHSSFCPRHHPADYRGLHGGWRPDSLGWRSFAALAVGIGTSLVLDEFALILHLQDVYWSGEGQLSVEAVSLTAARLGLALVGFSPFGVQDVDGFELTLRVTATGILIADGVLSVICVLKGKYRTALFGLFLLPVGVIGALRLARPSSIWARHYYRGRRLERTPRRAADFDQRWAPLQTDWEDFVGGKPSRPNPPASDDVHR
jgi:hypothetical protein